MLRDAARLQLRLTREALAESLITKDSAYNIQFTGSKPVFIDVGSFERLRKGEPWAGYRQFCELFLNPLYVQAVADVPFQPLLRGHLDGITPASPQRSSAGGAGSARACSRTSGSTPAPSASTPTPTAARRPRRAARRIRSALIDAQLRNLEKAVERLSWKQDDSTWSGYGGRSHYSDSDLEAKSSFVAAAVASAGTCTVVLDLGANDGQFSRVAVAAGAKSVVAVDSDHLVVDRLYREPSQKASAASSRSSSTSPTRRRRSAGVPGSARRSSNACVPTSCSASPSSTTWR